MRHSGRFLYCFTTSLSFLYRSKSIESAGLEQSDELQNRDGRADIAFFDAVHEDVVASTAVSAPFGFPVRSVGSSVPAGEAGEFPLSLDPPADRVRLYARRLCRGGDRIASGERREGRFLRLREPRRELNAGPGMCPVCRSSLRPGKPDRDTLVFFMPVIYKILGRQINIYCAWIFSVPPRRKEESDGSRFRYFAFLRLAGEHACRFTRPIPFAERRTRRAPASRDCKHAHRLHEKIRE